MYPLFFRMRDVSLEYSLSSPKVLYFFWLYEYVRGTGSNKGLSVQANFIINKWQEYGKTRDFIVVLKPLLRDRR